MHRRRSRWENYKYSNIKKTISGNNLPLQKEATSPYFFFQLPYQDEDPGQKFQSYLARGSRRPGHKSQGTASRW